MTTSASNLEQAAKRGSLLAATALAQKAGLPRSAISAITAAAGGNRARLHAGAALLAESIGLSSKTAKKAKKKPLRDDPPADDPPKEKPRKPIKWEDVDEDEDSRAIATRGNVRNRLARLERGSRSNVIGNEMLERTLAARGLPTTIRGLERAQRDAYVSRDVAERRSCAPTSRSKADEARDLDRVAKMSGFASHRELMAAARKAGAATFKTV